MMIQHELQPWIILAGQVDQPQPVLWQLEQASTPALALFSTSERSRTYAQEHVAQPWQVTQLDQKQLVGLLIEYYKQGMRLAVLDPNQANCQRAFDIRQILAAARDVLAGQA